ncbi:MAG TPA: hypothetical protein VEF72_14900, partial [Mycobacterium sp.]|nr:hypothetical protein [Mycobacterium sp.]
VTLLGRFYERFADHAVEIAKRVIFQAHWHTPRQHRTRRLAAHVRHGVAAL